MTGATTYPGSRDVDNSVTVLCGPVLDAAEVADSSLLEKEEQDLLEAVRHVNRARVQRKRFQEHISAARSTLQTIKTSVVNYGQNMQLPWFGSNQPGSTYYYTPLNLHNPGIVDIAHNGDGTVYYHMYTESKVQKGGNNVASLIMMTLYKLGLIDDDGITTLNIVFKNALHRIKTIQ